MPTHLEQMTERLPHLYREGELVQGVLALAAVQMEIAEEDGREVQRSHWFNATLDLGEAERLAMPLDIPREEWQSHLAEYRAWVHAIRNAMLQHGSVTRPALQRFVEQYSEGFQQAVRIRVLPDSVVWGDRTAEQELVFEEQPPLRRIDPAFALEPLQQFSILQRGLDATPAAFLLTGIAGAPEFMPLIANLTTGQAVLFRGRIREGERLWLRPTDDGTVEAMLGTEDVSARLHSIASLEPGVPWVVTETPAQAITLVPGENELWFLPVAHFDEPGLDRFLLALADLQMRQGRWNEAELDRSLFYQQPGVQLTMTWVETQPATFAIRLPASILRNAEGELDESLAERDRLALSLDRAVQSLRPAAVRASVSLEPFREIQGQGDHVEIVAPPRFREVGPTGADRMPDAGGVFEVTDFNDSTFR